MPWRCSSRNCRVHVFELANEAYYQLVGRRDLIGRPAFEPLPEAAHEGANAVALVADVASDVPQRLVGDALRLRQVLLNLLSNAVKFTSHGSVTLRVVALVRDEDMVLLRLDVIYTGIGITTEQQQRIFEPFAQADSTITRRFGGSGLGLSIVQRLVDMMNGTISVESQPGRGSTFSVKLPFSPS